MAFLSELIVCAICLAVWFGLAALVVALLCVIFGADKIAAAIVKVLDFFGLD
jgi:hypothetical protein